MDNIDWAGLRVVLVGNGPLSDSDRTKINNDYDVIVRFNNLRNFIKGEKTTILCTNVTLWNHQIKKNISSDTIIWFLKYKGLTNSLRNRIERGKCEVIKKASGKYFTYHNKIYPTPRFSENKIHGYKSSYGFRVFLYISQKKPHSLDYYGFSWSCSVCHANYKNKRKCCTGHHWVFEHNYITKHHYSSGQSSDVLSINPDM